MIYEVVSSKSNFRLVHSNVEMFILSTVFIICKKNFFPFTDDYYLCYNKYDILFMLYYDKFGTESSLGTKY